MAAKDSKPTEMQMINKWVWFFLLYFSFILLIAGFGLVAEF